MSVTIKASGDTWRVELGGNESTRTVVFFCESTNQRPYRVVQVGDRFAGPEDLANLDSDGLRELFDRSGSMGAPTGYPTYSS